MYCRSGDTLNYSPLQRPAAHSMDLSFSIKKILAQFHGSDKAMPSLCERVGFGSMCMEMGIERTRMWNEHAMACLGQEVRRQRGGEPYHFELVNEHLRGRYENEKAIKYLGKEAIE